jgi:hypothetical protein
VLEAHEGSVDAAARQEWLDAVAHYVDTLGTRGALRFVRAVQHAIERIAEAHHSFVVIGTSKRLRKARVLRYPSPHDGHRCGSAARRRVP